MAGPWEAFQQEGPWTQFQQAQEIEQPPLSAAITDIPAEISNAVQENLDAIKTGVTNKAEQGVFGGQLATGRAMLALPGLLAAPITGAARSLLGHPLAQAEHAIGALINPQIAARDNPQEMYQTAKSNVDTAMAGIAPRGASPMGVRTVPAAAPSAEELKAAGRSVFTNPEIKNRSVPAQDVSDLSAQIENSLIQQGYRPTTDSAPGTFAEIRGMAPKKPPEPAFWDRVQAEMNRQPIEAPSVKNVTVDDLRAARRALQKKALLRDERGKPTTEATAAIDSLGQLDGFISTLAPELKTANANYSAGKILDALDFRAQRARRRAAKTGSGSNIENSMRQEADLIQNRGLTADERALKEQIVFGTKPRNALRKIGKLGFSDGLSFMYHGGLAAPTLGLNLPVGIAATVARKVGERLTRKEMNALAESVARRSPLAQSMSPQVLPQPGMLGGIFGGLLPRPMLPYFPVQIPAYADQDK